MYEFDGSVTATLQSVLSHVRQAEAQLASTLHSLPEEDLSLVSRIAQAGSDLDRIVEMLDLFMESPIVQLGTDDTKLLHWPGMARAYLELVDGGQLASVNVDRSTHKAKVIISDLQMDVTNMYPGQAKELILFWLQDVYESTRVVEWHDLDESVQRLIDKLEGRIE